MMLTEDREVVASSTECTGLVPALTDARGEAEECRLCDVTAAKRKKREKKQ